MDENNQYNQNNQNDSQNSNGNFPNYTGENQNSNNTTNNFNQAYENIAGTAKDGGKSFFSNILNFDVMISAKLIKLIYFISLVVTVIGGIVTMFSRNPFTGSSNFFLGLVILVLGPIGIRVWAELMIVIFNINDNLAKIKDYFYNKK